MYIQDTEGQVCPKQTEHISRSAVPLKDWQFLADTQLSRHYSVMGKQLPEQNRAPDTFEIKYGIEYVAI